MSEWIDGRRKEAKERSTSRAPARKRGTGTQTWTICRLDGCSRKLRSDNRSGFCWRHYQLGSQCRRCLAPCSQGHPVCQRCRVKGDKERAEKVAPCTAVGCTVVVHGKTGMCREHWRASGGTCGAKGCEVAIIFGSKTGYCARHMHYARTERRRAERQKR